MTTFVMYAAAIISVAIVIFMLIKKMDIKITLFLMGIVLMFVGCALGNPLGGEDFVSTGSVFLDPLKVIADQFKSTISSAGFIILILGGYSAYMSAINANSVKGDGSEKAHNVNAHDAGLDGVTLADKGDTVEVTLKTLNGGDKISIAGKNYTIGSTVKDAKDAVGASTDGDKIKVGDTEYVYADGTNTASKDGKAPAGWYTSDTDFANTLTANLTAKTIDNLLTAGSKVTVGSKTFAIINDANTADGIDDKDSTVITAGKAYQLQTAEIVKASSIGADTAAVNNTPNNNDYDKATTSFELKKGTVSYKDSLSFNLHVGADADMTNKITVNIDSMNSAGLGVKGIKADTEQDATYAIDAIADAISTVSSQRSALGAVQNRLEHTINNLDNVVENTTTAESRIRDTDMAEEMVNYSKNNILAQAGQSMLAQANQSNQGVLSLLQ